jgi:hypothetical protein
VFKIAADRLLGMTADEQQKAAFRRWAREHHPDVGGDPEVFAAGLQAAREGRFNEPAESPVSEESRTTVYVHRSIHGLARVIVATQKWNARRRRPPRVR